MRHFGRGFGSGVADPVSPELSAIILAGGHSRRLGTDKLLLPLRERPVLAWTLNAFACSLIVDRIVLVTSERNRQFCSELLEDMGMGDRTDLVVGGTRRQDSARAGLLAAATEWVAVHDGARPFVTSDLIERGLNAAQATGAAVPCLPVTDTIKRIDDQGRIVKTLNRSELVSVQTPQFFRRDLLLDAVASAGLDVTDDSSLVEAIGSLVHTFRGDPSNIKITRTEDIELAEMIAGRAFVR